jgi:polygalacturonase
MIKKLIFLFITPAILLAFFVMCTVPKASTSSGDSGSVSTGGSGGLILGPVTNNFSSPIPSATSASSIASSIATLVSTISVIPNDTPGNTSPYVIFANNVNYGIVDDADNTTTAGVTTGTDNTSFIQQALNDAGNAAISNSTPYIVVMQTSGVHTGKILSGPIAIPSNVYLKIEANTTLLFKPYAGGNPSTLNNTSSTNFITNSGTATSTPNTNIGLLGTGTIDGNGGSGYSGTTWSGKSDNWWGAYNLNNSISRPRLIYLTSVTNIIVRDLKLTNSPSFHFVPKTSTNVVVTNLNINTWNTSPNTDGVDPSSCTNVWIDHCNISTGDDNIAIKTANGLSSNIYVTNCNFGTDSAPASGTYLGHGLSIGSETNTGLNGLYVDNCNFYYTQNGIRIKSTPPGRSYDSSSLTGNGGEVQNCRYTNITMKNVKYVIYLSAYYSTLPGGSNTPGGASRTDAQQNYIPGQSPYFHDILIQNMTATTTATATGTTYGGIILGLPENFINNIVLNNVNISGSGGSYKGLEVGNANVFITNGTSITASSGSNYFLDANEMITSF